MGAPSKNAHIRELMHRSWKNYEYLKKEQEKGHSVYEVTQLISTFLLAAGHPREQKFEAPLNNLTLQQAQSDFGFPLTPLVHTLHSRNKKWKEKGVQHSRPFDANTYLGDLIQFLRNAIAHGNIAFPNDNEGEEISLLEFRNMSVQQVRDTASFSVSDLERVTEGFIRIADALFAAEDSGVSANDFLSKHAS